MQVKIQAVDDNKEIQSYYIFALDRIYEFSIADIDIHLLKTLK